MNNNRRNDGEETDETSAESEIEPMVNVEDDRCSIGNDSFVGVLDDFVSDDDDDVSKKRKRRPWLGAISIIILVVCVVMLAVGLYVGLTRNRTELKPEENSDEGVDTQSSPNEDTNGTEGMGADDMEGTNETGGTDLISNETDNIAMSMRSLNAAGVIRDGKFRSLESHPLPNATIPTFGQSSMNKYLDCQAFEDDLYNTLSIIVNEVILAHANSESLPYYIMDEDTIVMPAMPIMPETTADSSIKMELDNSFETNNQVYGVDEADVVKSTSEYVFAAYGDKLVVWNATSGEMYSTTKLQKLQRKNNEKMVPPDMRQSVRIRSLLLYDNRLAVIVDGLDEKKGWEEVRIFHGYQSPSPSRVLVYEISKIPKDGSKLPLIAARDLGGRYTDARLIGSVVHLVSMTNIDTYTHLRRHFSRAEKRFSDLNSTEYVANATSYATGTLIPSFIERMLDDFFDRDTMCEDMMKISMLRTSNEDKSVPEVGPILDGYVQVDSFDILTVPNTDKVVFLEASVTGSFVPNSHDATVYASGDTLILANQGYKYDPKTDGWRQNTFIMTFSFDGGNGVGVIPGGFAEVPGYIMNQYSLDIWGGYLRMASTIGSRWGCQTSDDEESTCIWTMTEDSDNFVSVYKLPDEESSDLSLVGFLNNLGEVGERIEAVRFMGDKAFIVTFLRTDPLYTINLKNASFPQVYGELKVTGFSNYLHPYDEEGNFIIGIGQDADQEGTPTGLQISLFNATDMSNTTLVNRFNVKDSPDSFSSSAAQYDPKSFRFVPASKKLIIPSRIGYPGDGDFFDGFLVFDVSLYGIDYNFNVSHTVDIDGEPDIQWCWYSAYLQPRSLVHEGVLTTIKGHTVLGTDLYTRIIQWKLNLDSENKDCSDGGYWSIPSIPEPIW